MNLYQGRYIRLYIDDLADGAIGPALQWVTVETLYGRQRKGGG